MSEDRPNFDYIIGDTVFRAPPLQPGLHIVATPIGNLADITLRALQVLAAADIIACEDTRTTGILLNRYGIKTRMLAFHSHNEAAATARIEGLLVQGQSVALVSDAGTPLISDPGYRLVASLRACGHRVVAVPGASALPAALSISGLPTDAALFAGFLPARSGQRKQVLAGWRSIPATLVFYESPHRIAESLADMAEVLGPDRAAALCREMTKTFEEVITGTLAELAERIAAAALKGEIVVVIAPPAQADAASDSDVDALLVQLAQSMKPSAAAAEASRLTGRPKPDLYKRLLELKSDA